MASADEHVVLLHGLCRTPRSMAKMERALSAEGYHVHNLSYPTRKKPIRALVNDHLRPLLLSPEIQGATKVHFVTHSLGGILVRQYLADHSLENLGRLVFLAPPNQGSEVVDRVGHWRLYHALTGPAGQELGTTPESTPNKLGPLNHPHAIIAGSRSLNWINSIIIAGPDDGKVSVARTKLPETSHHLTLPVTHPFLIRNSAVIRETIYYLKSGALSSQEK